MCACDNLGCGKTLSTLPLSLVASGRLGSCDFVHAVYLFSPRARIDDGSAERSCASSPRRQRMNAVFDPHKQPTSRTQTGFGTSVWVIIIIIIIMPIVTTNNRGHT